MSKSQRSQQSLNFETAFAFLVFVPMLIKPNDPRVPQYLRALADSLETMMQKGDEAVLELFAEYDDIELIKFIALASHHVLIPSGLKPLDAVEELRELAAEFDADYGHVAKEQEAVA